MRCDEVTESLAGVADGSVTLGVAARRHVERCLRCQAEVAQYKKLLRALRTMRTELLDPAPGMLTDILATISDVGERQAVRQLLAGRRAAYVGGIAAATAAAGAAGAIVLASLSKRSRLHLAS